MKVVSLLLSFSCQCGKTRVKRKLYAHIQGLFHLAFDGGIQALDSENFGSDIFWVLTLLMSITQKYVAQNWILIISRAKYKVFGSGGQYINILSI